MRAHHISENPETEDRRLGGPVTQDLTMWDLNKTDCRTKCRKLVVNSKPFLLIGSPIDFGGRDKQQARAVLDLAFICELYATQVRRGRYFLHTHSHSADSWDQPTMVDFMNRCMGTPPKRKHGHERDATQLASSGSIPAMVAPKSHVTARVWCVWRCAIKASNRSFHEHHPWKVYEFCPCGACEENVFRVEDPF